ncbi:MAG: zf-HC2 domain-containing protein [Phycisphaerales bacterium JB039]
MRDLVRGILLILTVRCQRADRLLSERAVRKLRWYESVAAHSHSSICRSCRRARRQLRALNEIMAERAARGEPLTGELSPETAARLAGGLPGGPRGRPD